MTAIEPFAKVERQEIAKLANLSSVEIRVLAAVRVQTHNGWATTRREVAKVAACSDSRAKLALARLERLGWFRRVWCGGEEAAPWGRFKVGATRIGSDPGPAANPDRIRSGYTLQVPDRSNPPPSKTVRIARAAGAGREGGSPSGVHPGAEPDALLALCRKLWPELAVKPARKYLAALRELAEGASEDELARYLRRAADDRTLETARVPLAVASSPDRVRAWRRKATRQAAKRREAQPKSGAAPVLSARELAELAAAASRRL